MSDHNQALADAAKGVTDVAKAFESYKSVNDQRIAEIEKKGVADPLIGEQLARIEADLDKAQRVADNAVLAVKRRERISTDAQGNEVDLEAKATKWIRSVSGDKKAELTVDGMKDFRAAMDTYMRKGDRAMESAEFKALSVGSDVNGGYVVHPDMGGRIVEFERETSAMRAYASTQTISTDALEGLYDIDEASFEWVAETQTRAETDTPELGAWRIPVHEMSAMPKATQKLLDDAEINIEQWLAGKVSAIFSRGESTAFVTGDGTARPRGFLTYADLAVAGTFENGKIEQFNTGANGAFAAAPDGGDVLINALYGLKATYRANATWFMNRKTTSLTRKLKDSDGAYLWAPGIAAGQPASLLGYPTASFEDMPNPATGSLSIAVGDMRRAYQIVDRSGIRVLRDPYGAKPHVLFYSTKRVGGAVLDFEALKIINFKA
mgnify:CR=1 FL=1|tara:strand:- start:5208 stop:6515 length:1308 start_codon:yes stop_codon:yes gene_type:complete